jgi:uncharacterized protein (DUF1015 family)
MQEIYYERDPYNFVRLNLPRDKDPYSSSRDTLKQWLSVGILKKEDKPNFYHYVQDFKMQGMTYERNGFFAVVKLERYESKNIFPHERTFSGPKEDRLRMLRSTNVDLEPVFFLYDDPELDVLSIFKNSTEEKVADVTDDNDIRHTLYRVYSLHMENFFKDKKLAIADGHHRYETALAFAEERGRVNGTGYIMAVLVNRYDTGLIILPSHRIIEESDVEPQELLHKMEEFFEVSEIRIDTVKGFLKNDLVFCFRNHAYSMKLKSEYAKGLSLSDRLNVSILNKFVVSIMLSLDSKEKIKYARWPEEIWPLINEGKAKFAFMVKPVSPSTVWDVAMNGEIMPQKSTDFYPKLMSGIEMFDLDEKI